MAMVAGRTDAAGGDSSGRAHTDAPSLRGLLDVLVYAPIGFALSAGTLVPELAAKGRARAQEQVRLARMIGEFAVPVVRRKGARIVREQVDRATRSAATRIKSPHATGHHGPPEAEAEATVAPKLERQDPELKSTPAETRPTPKPVGARKARTPRTPRTVPTTAVLGLPIDGYDELPASSIITLLDGLRPAQLRALDAHERANRGRRTVLTRIGQLLT